MERVGRGQCPICDQFLPGSGRCANFWCSRPVEERFFQFIFAIAMRSGPLQDAINKYKYQDKTGWASIFGRVLVGYMDEAPDRVTGWNAIVPSPTYIGEGSRRSWDHIALILEKAKIEAADRWPQLADEPGLIVKTADTPSMMGKTLTQRRQIAETDIRSSLHIPDPARVVGRSFLVFDDVFTDGSTLREIARALLAAGATEVGGLVLARQPWTF